MKGSSAPPSSSTVSLADLVAMLAPALGHEHSQQLVNEGAKQLNHAGQRLTLPQAVELLNALRATDGDKGLVSVAARMTQSRLETRRRKVVSDSPARGRPGAKLRAPPLHRDTPEPAGAECFTDTEIVSLLAPTLGEQRSQELVSDLINQMGLAVPMCRADLTRLLDALEVEQGIVGVVARFARGRLARGS